MVDLRCSVRRVAGWCVLVVDGIVDLSSTPRLHDALTRLLADHPGGRLAVELDGASLLDDAALGLLLGAAASARGQGGELRLVCRDPRLRQRLAETRVDQIVEVTDSLRPPLP